MHDNEFWAELDKRFREWRAGGGMGEGLCGIINDEKHYITYEIRMKHCVFTEEVAQKAFARLMQWVWRDDD